MIVFVRFYKLLYLDTYERKCSSNSYTRLKRVTKSDSANRFTLGDAEPEPEPEPPGHFAWSRSRNRSRKKLGGSGSERGVNLNEHIIPSMVYYGGETHF